MTEQSHLHTHIKPRLLWLATILPRNNLKNKNVLDIAVAQ